MTVNISQIDTLGALLQQSQMRHEVISSNIANVNTPHYHTLEVNFESVLKAAADDLAKPRGEVQEVQGLVERLDGNNVDIDHELAKMTKNGLAYQTYSQLLASKLGTYRSAISGRS